jgi:hypothetical protein
MLNVKVILQNKKQKKDRYVFKLYKKFTKVYPFILFGESLTRKVSNKTKEPS